MRWYRKAAGAGDYEALMILSYRYRDGEITAKNMVLAHVFAALADRSPSKLAAESLAVSEHVQKLASALSPEQRVPKPGACLKPMTSIRGCPVRRTIAHSQIL